MIVFRITLNKYADKLLASGNPARWNSRDVKVIYTAESRSLACLENVVHRSSRGLQAEFKTLLINIPDNVEIELISRESLQPGWQSFENIPYTQQLGNEWIKRKKTPVLKVPSAIIPGEFNYLINPQHPEFSQMKLIAAEPFEFDVRIKMGR